MQPHFGKPRDVVGAERHEPAKRRGCQTGAEDTAEKRKRDALRQEVLEDVAAARTERRSQSELALT